MKCVAPNSTIKDFDALLQTPGFYFYCKDHHNLSVHKLLKKIAAIEDKFKKCFTEVNQELNDFQKSLQDCGLNDSPIENEVPVETAAANQPPQPTLPTSTAITKSQSQSVKRKNTEVVSNDTPKRSKSLSLDQQNASPHPSITQTFASNENTEISNKLEENLFALPKSWRVFLSHLPAEASVKAIENHLSKMNIPLDNVKIEKFTFRSPRRYSSFVINVEDDKIFSHLVNPSHWPSGTIVHEYNSSPDFQKTKRRMIL